MRKSLGVLAVSLAMIGSLSCTAMTNYYGPVGFIYENTKSPFPHEVEDISYSKVGRACSTSILGWFATGDASVEAAAKSAGIKKVKLVTIERTGIMGLYATFCTIVKGD